MQNAFTRLFSRVFKSAPGDSNLTHWTGVCLSEHQTLLPGLQESTKHFSSRLKDLYEQHGRWTDAKPYRRELEKLGELYYQKAQQGCIEEGAGWTYYVKVRNCLFGCYAMRV